MVDWKLNVATWWATNIKQYNCHYYKIWSVSLNTHDNLKVLNVLLAVTQLAIVLIKIWAGGYTLRFATRLGYSTTKWTNDLYASSIYQIM